MRSSNISSSNDRRCREEEAVRDSSVADQNAELNSLYSAAFAPAVESIGMTPQKHDQIDPGDHQQNIASSMGRSITMRFKKDLPETTLQQNQLVISSDKKMLSTNVSGSNERLKLQASHESATKATHNQSVKLVAAANIERPVEVLQSSGACQVQPQHQQGIIGQRNLQSLSEMAWMQDMEQTETSNPARDRHSNYPQRQLNYAANQLALPPITDFQSYMINDQTDQNACNNFFKSNTSGLIDLAGEQSYSTTNFMNSIPSSRYSVATSGFNNPCYSSPLYGFDVAERSFAPPPGMQLHDHRLSISSESPTLSSDSKSSLISPFATPYSSPRSPYKSSLSPFATPYSSPGSPYKSSLSPFATPYSSPRSPYKSSLSPFATPYSSPGSPYKSSLSPFATPYSSPGSPYVAQPLVRAGQYASGAPTSSSNTRFLSKSASAHSPSNQLYGFESPPSTQLHDHRLSESPILRSDHSKRSLSPFATPYSSPGSPYIDAQPPVRVGQYASGPPRFLSKSASAHSPSSRAGASSSPDRRVPFFQLEKDVLTMQDGVVLENQTPLQRANYSDSTAPNYQQRTGESISSRAPSFEHSRNISFPDPARGQYIAKEGDDQLLQRGYSLGGQAIDSSSSATSSEMRSHSISRLREESRSGARSNANSNAGEIAAECRPESEPPDYSTEASKLPADLDFLYNYTLLSESMASMAQQAEVSSPSNSSPSSLGLWIRENAPFTSASIMPSPSKETKSTAQPSHTSNMVVAAPKSPAISPVKSISPLPKHAAEAPPFIPAKRASFPSMVVETAQSYAKTSPFLPHMHGKNISSPHTGNSSSPPPSKETKSTAQTSHPSNMVVAGPKSPAISPAKGISPLPKHAAEAPPFIPANRASFPSTEAETAQSSAKSSPFLPITPGTSTSSSHKGTSTPASPSNKMAQPAKRPPLYRKKAASPISPAKYPPS